MEYETPTLNTPTSTNSWVGRIGSMFLTIPSNLISNVERCQAVYALPNAEYPLAGIVLDHHQVVPLFDLENKPVQRNYQVILKSDQGLIALAVDEIFNEQSAQKLNDELHPDAQQIDIKKLLGGFSLAEKGEESIIEQDPQNLKMTDLLLIAVKNQKYFLSATFIQRIEKYKKASPLRDSPAHQCSIILSDDTVIRGISLPILLAQDESVTTTTQDDQWAILIEDPSSKQPVALIASNVVGVEKISPNNMFSIASSHKLFHWVTHSQYGAIEILDPLEIMNPNQVQNPKIDQAKPPPKKKVDDLKKDTTNDLEVSFADFGYRLLIPNSLILSVDQSISISDLRSDQIENSIPVFDFVKMVGLTDQNDSLIRRVIYFQSSKLKRIAVIVPNIRKKGQQNSIEWQNKPCLPDHLFKLVSKIRIVDGLPEYLINPSYLKQIIDKIDLDQIHHPSFAGWLAKTTLQFSN
jgi:chemotaxis signal transduction protein